MIIKIYDLVLPFVFIFLFGILSTKMAMSQEVVQGQIINLENQSPILSASIQVSGSETGTLSNEDGRFAIDCKIGDTLIISAVGYLTSNFLVENQGPLRIMLTPSLTKLEDVVVVGYGTLKKKEVTGAITTIGSKDFNSGFNTRPIQQIQGKVPGLVITQSDGNPTGEFDIRLRGQASLTGGQTPLIVVDGVALDDANQLSFISPDDISSYDVLKDASASAIYGSRGANGIILITTKKGVAGESRIDYSGSVGINRMAKSYSLLSPNEYREAIGTATSIYDKGGNTNWYKAITRTAIVHEHNLAISGGTNDFNYRASGFYSDQQGIVINSGREKSGVNFNAEQKALNGRLRFNLNVMVSKTLRNLTNPTVFTWATNNPPTYPVFNSDGTYFGWQDFDQMNPVAVQNMEKNISKESFSMISPSINYKIVNDLNIGLNTSFLDRNIQDSYFHPEIPGVPGVNSASKSNSNNRSLKGDLHLNYSHTWNRNSISAIIVAEYNKFQNSSSGLSGQEFLIEELEDNNMQGGNHDFNNISSSKDEFKLASYLGRINYNFASRYYLTASYRRDGSSKFGRENRWADFPSISIAWRVTQENFFHVDWINELKISLGYGVTGNQDAISPYNSLLTLGSTGSYYDGVRDGWFAEYAPNQNQNERLRWEERHGRNVGLDLEAFGSRLILGLNYFNDKTKNLLFNYNVPVPPFFVGTMLANIGTLTNKGFEANISGNLIQNKHLVWTANGQISFLKTRITSLSGNYGEFHLSTDHVISGYATGRGYASNAIIYMQVNQTPNVFFLPHFIRVGSDGRQVFSDGKGGEINSDQLTNEANRFIDPAPKFTYGFGSSLSFKDWSLDFFLIGNYGQKIFNNTLSLLDNLTRLPGNNVVKQAISHGINEQQVASDLWLENASYLRLDNLTISHIFSKINGLKNLGLFITGNNLFVITKYKGLDPEVNINRIDISYSGLAFYPRSRSYSFGLKVSL